MRRLVPLAFVALVACLESPQSEVAYSAFATSDLAPSFEANGVRVRLSRAEFAFGPAYFCAASSGSSALCKSALGELVQVSRIDLLTPGPQALGTVKGFTGQVRSVSYDLGLHWFDTSFAVEPSSAAPEAHSMVFEGTLARVGEPEEGFRLVVDVVPQYHGQRAVPTAAAEAEIVDERTQLTVALTPEAWLRQIDFDAVLRTAKRPIVLDTKSPAHDSVLVGLKVARPPEFRFSRL